MTELVTDLGTLSLLAQLRPDGRVNLVRFLDACDRGRVSWATFDQSHFHGRPDLVGMELNYDPDDRRPGRVLATCDFGNSTWRRGSLRIADIELPHTVMAGIKGRRIGDVVDNAPFPDFIISHAVHDRKQGRVTLRIRCSGEELAPIPRSRP